MAFIGYIGTQRFRFLATLVVFATFVASNRPVSAYTPKDPIVTKMVDRGIKYLETKKLTLDGSDALSRAAGEVMLVGYAHHKCRHDPEAPLVKTAIKTAKDLVSDLEAGRGGMSSKRHYTMSMCVLLFAEVDAKRYKNEMAVIQRHLLEAQMDHGGFGYPGEREGDVSQVQYVILALWTLDRNGLPLDYNRVLSTAQWLLRVQDTNGGWPYHGHDPGPGKPNITQKDVGMSMTLAGGSSILIAGDALRLWGDTVDDVDPGILGLPEAIKIYKEDTNVGRRKRVTMSAEPIRRSIKFMDGWRQKNPYKRRGIDWFYYQLYTLERFESFVEISRGLPKDSSPAWYNQGVDELRQYQDGEGGWTDRSHTSGQISTAFALLFLIRSTQKTIFTMSEGNLQGGYGLPKDTTDIRVEGTQIKGRKIAAQVTDMLDLLEKDGAGETEGKSLPDNLELDKNPVARSAQLDRLERLVRGSRSWQARRVAAKLLGVSDELRVVPAMIFALSDPDKSVRRYARDGLRFISRKFDGYGMPDDPTQADVQNAQKKWRDWYRTMNPKHVFLDYDL
jgi:hypothetical protein